MLMISSGFTYTGSSLLEFLATRASDAVEMDQIEACLVLVAVVEKDHSRTMDEAWD